MSCPAHPQTETTTPCARCGMGYCDDCLVIFQNERVCATCKGEVLRDVMSGTQLTGLPLASIGRRFGAWLIDRVIFFVLQVTLQPVLTTILNSLHTPYVQRFAIYVVLQIAVIVCFLLYDAVTVAASGQTIGKAVAGVRVAAADGTRVTRRQAWIRALVRVAMLAVALPLPARLVLARGIVGTAAIFIDDVPGLVTKERTAVHDMVAGTRVVRVGR